MTNIYFITPTKEKEKLELITNFLEDKNIDVIYSSPFKSAVETIREYGIEKEIPMYAVTEFGEMELLNEPKETYEEVEERMIDGLAMLVNNEADQTILVATHPIALSSAIHYFDETFGEEDCKRIQNQCPVIFKFAFEGEVCKEIEEIKAL